MSYQTEISNQGWKTNDRTSLWLTQQSSLNSTISPADEDANRMYIRPTRSKRPPPPEFEPSDRSSPKKGRGYGSHFFYASQKHGNNSNSICPRASYDGSNVYSLQDHPTAEASPIGPPNAQEPLPPFDQTPYSSITHIEEQNCSKCAESKNLFADSIGNISKLAMSFTSGELAKILAPAMLHEKVPYIPEAHRFFDILAEVNRLAIQLAASALPAHENEFSSKNLLPSNADPSFEVMKLRFLTNPQKAVATHSYSHHDRNGHQRELYTDDSHTIGLPMITTDTPRGLTAVGVPNNDKLAPIRTVQFDGILGESATGNQSGTASRGGNDKAIPSMNPPPTPNHYASPQPPVQGTQSPQPQNLPSPRSLAFSQPVTCACSAPLPHSATSTLQQPISPTTSSHSGGLSPAIQAHTASLQHELSVRKLALSTLQSEHDKLLDAFSRSKARARALEEKQATCDHELNSFAEERVRFSTQISELEEALEGAKKSKEEYRMAAIKERQQYVEIVRMASRLEERVVMDGRELAKRRLAEDKADSLPQTRSVEQAPENGALNAIIADEALDKMAVQQLKTEIWELRNRCTTYEGALRDIKDENQKVDEICSILMGSVQKVASNAESVLSAGLPKVSS